MQGRLPYQEDREGPQRVGWISLDETDFQSDQVDLLCKTAAGGPYGSLSSSLCPGPSHRAAPPLLSQPFEHARSDCRFFVSCSRSGLLCGVVCQIGKNKIQEDTDTRYATLIHQLVYSIIMLIMKLTRFVYEQKYHTINITLVCAPIFHELNSRSDTKGLFHS